MNKINFIMDKFYAWAAYKLPQRLVFFCAKRAIWSSVVGKHYKTRVEGIRAVTVLKRWEEDNKK